MKNCSFLKIVVVSALLLVIQACAIIYEQDIQQGNVVTDKMLNNLELGMSKAEAQYYLGTPLIEDPFHANRWDYFYTYQQGRDDEREQRVITLWFDDFDRLADIKGSAEVVITQATEVTLPDGSDLNTVAVEPEEKASLWQRVKSKVLGQ